MVRIIAIIFVVLNSIPLVWMVWSSLMGNDEIMQGRIFPSPYRSDVSFFRPVEKLGLVAGTLHGQVYRFPSGHLTDPNRINIDLSAVTVRYALRDKELFAFSPDEALMEVNLESGKKVRQWNWNLFKKSFQKRDFTQFRFVSNQIPDIEFSRLAGMLNSASLLSDGTGGSLADQVHQAFPEDSSVIERLNQIMNSAEQIRHVLSVWSHEKNWVNPVISDLYQKKSRTVLENKELFRWCLAERIPHELTRFRQIPWEPLWVNRVPASDHGVSLASVGKYLCMGVWWEAFPGIAILNPDNLSSIRWITVNHGLPTSSIQDILRVSDSEILVAHDQGFSLVDIEAEKVKANFLFGEAGLPYYNGRDLRLALVGRSAMLFTYGREIVFFDFRAGRALKRVFGDEGVFQSDITALQVHNDEVYFGSSEGVVAVPLWDLLNGETASKKVYTNYMLNRKDSTRWGNGVVSSLFLAKGRIWAGGLKGQLAEIHKQGTRGETCNLPSGGVYLHWRNYEDLLRTIPFKTFLMNSLIICCSTVLLSILLASMAGYALARFHFFGKDILHFTVLWTQVVPGVLYLIPVFLGFSYLQQHTSIHLLNTKIGIILVYSALFTPMTTWVLRGFFMAVPHELEEAALIDGCSRFKAFFRVVLPSAFPGILATSIYTFILAWDELMFVWVLSMDMTTATIPVGMRLFVGQFGNRFDLMMAAATLSTIPVLILFLGMQTQMLFGISGSTRNRNH
jgi:ABC-type glycerol-3-phosphate transport system permease component